MGLETLLIAGAIAGGVSTVVSTVGAVNEAEAEAERLYQQEVELNKIAAAEASDAAREADKKAAAAIAAMEAIGGFGSYNDTRLQLEMAGLKGLDLARIESNRARQAANLLSARKSALAAGQNAIFTGIGQLAGTTLSYYGGKSILQADKVKKVEDLNTTRDLDKGK
jgi:hypothetical protein